MDDTPDTTASVDVTYVDDFHVKEEDEDGSYEPKPKRKRGAARVWVKVAEFSTPEEAESHVNAESIWKKASTKHSRDGTKVEYRCSAGKYRVNDCPAGVYLLYHATDTKVSLFQTDCDHDNHNSDPSRGLPVDVKHFVNQLFENGTQKPNAILSAIRREKFPEISKAKLISYLKRIRSEKFGGSTVSAADIQMWCCNKKEVPADEDEPFVLDYLLQAESQTAEDQDLKIIVSTRRLLANLKKSTMIQIDSTHKLIWQGYPIMLFGTSDKDHNFHPLGLAICKDVETDDFKFVFKAFRKLDPQWDPQFLLADGCVSITEAFRQIFGDIKVRIVCFAYILKTLDKLLKGIKNDSYGAQMKQDILSLQTCADESSFRAATQLFLSRWRGASREVDEFLQSFEEICVSKQSTWHEGAAPGYPSANNGIEVLVKSERTIRERLPVDQFLNNVTQLVSKWSKSRDPKSAGHIVFADVPTISLHQWTAAYQWAMKNAKILQQNTDNQDTTIFLVNSSTSEQPITPEDVSRYSETFGKWTSFEEFQRIYHGTWKIILHKGSDRSQCDCPYFSKYSICKHVLGMKIRLKLVDPPTQAKSEGKKRGRPSTSSQAKRALLA